MRDRGVFLIMLMAALSAINAGLYAYAALPVSLGAAVFCGLMCITVSIHEAVQSR